MSEQILFAVLGLVFGGGIAWFFARGRQQTNQTPDYLVQMQQQLHTQMDRLTQQVDRRLRENTHAMNESKDFLANRVSAAEQSVRSVSAGLGKLEQATTNLQKTSDEIVSFQKLLKSPKIRGSFGEVLLNSLLAEILPHDRFELQYTLPSSGEIADAVIHLQDGHIVAIDSKFPLANYELFMNEENKELKKQLRKEWIRDVKKHLKDIGEKYISPQEKTLGYAFMYIPLEGVYYETMVQDADGDSLWEFCLAQHVIPVSPNSFLAYLQTILVGLKGMKIEQQAREILQHLGQLRQDFGKFAEDFTTVGTHLSNAKNRYDDSARRLDKFSNRLEQIEAAPHIPQLPQK